MTTTYTWKVEQLERRSFDGFVKQVHWRCVGTKGEYADTIYSSLGWEDGDPVVPFEDLTEEQVLAWVWEKVDKTATETAIATMIAAKETPEILKGLPWSNTN